MEQQGAANNRTFVLLNFRSIILAPTIDVIYILWILTIYQVTFVALIVTPMFSRSTGPGHVGDLLDLHGIHGIGFTT